MHPFDADTAVAAVAESRFAARVTGRWTTPAGTVNGGYLLAMCMQALGQVLPFPDPLAVSAHFLRRAQAGEPAQLVTELLRAGRGHATGEVALGQGGREIVRAIGTYTELDGRGRSRVDGGPPQLPPPGEVPDLLLGIDLPGVTIAERVEFRAPKRPGWLDGAPSGRAHVEFWARLRGGREPDLTALAFLVDAAAPAVLELGEMSSRTIELTVHLRARPAPGWLACRMSTRYVIGGYHEEDMELWDSAGQLVAQSRQLALLA
jgi:acyl-CoA thioesterase